MALITLELDPGGNRILRVLTGERPDFVGGAAKMAKDQSARDLAKQKHSAYQGDVQMCHVVAWSILTKKARRTFKGMPLEMADEWLSDKGNWPDSVVAPDALTRANRSRGMSLGQYSKVTKQLIEQTMEVWLKALNSWVENLWYGPARRNEAKGRMLNHCMNLVKKACLKSQPIYLGGHGIVTCHSGGRTAEFKVERWAMDSDRTWKISEELVASVPAAKDLFSSTSIFLVVMKAGMIHQKLRLQAGPEDTAPFEANAIVLTSSFECIKVSRQFDWSTFIGMYAGTQELNEKVFGDTPFRVKDFATLADFLLFSAIDLEGDVAHSPGERPSAIPLLFTEGYGHYLARLEGQEMPRSQARQ